MRIGILNKEKQPTNISFHVPSQIQFVNNRILWLAYLWKRLDHNVLYWHRIECVLMCMTYTHTVTVEMLCLCVQTILKNDALENSFFEFIMCRDQIISKQRKIYWIYVCAVYQFHKQEFNPLRQKRKRKTSIAQTNLTRKQIEIQHVMPHTHTHNWKYEKEEKCTVENVKM